MRNGVPIAGQQTIIAALEPRRQAAGSAGLSLRPVSATIQSRANLWRAVNGIEMPDPMPAMAKRNIRDAVGSACDAPQLCLRLSI